MLAALLMGTSAWADNVCTLYDTDGTTVIDSYETVDDAIKTLTKDGCTLVITSTEVTWGGSDTSNGRLSTAYSVTIKPASSTAVTIKTTQTNKSAQFSMGNGKTLTLDGSEAGASLTIDTNGNTSSTYEYQNASSSLVLKSVTITNVGAVSADNCTICPYLSSPFVSNTF